MLADLSFKTLLTPTPPLELEALRSLCRKLIPRETSWSINEDGLIDVNGAFDISAFVINGKLVASFNQVSMLLLKIHNMHALTGCPKTVHGVVDIRSQLLESLKGCPQSALSIYIEADHLKSLEDGPTNVTFYTVVSSKITSLKGISKTGIGTLAMQGCHSIKTTDGLDGVAVERLELPTDITEITEYPACCESIVYPACAGLPKLFLAEGLKQMSYNGMTSKRKLKTALGVKLDKMCERVLAVEGPKRRYLEAQTLLIDSDLEELL